MMVVYDDHVDIDLVKHPLTTRIADNLKPIPPNVRNSLPVPVPIENYNRCQHPVPWTVFQKIL